MDSSFPNVVNRIQAAWYQAEKMRLELTAHSEENKEAIPPLLEKLDFIEALRVQYT